MTRRGGRNFLVPMKWMTRLFLWLACGPAWLGLNAAPHAGEAWVSTRLQSAFYAEGVGVGDLNGDGHPDLSYGPFWYPGPTFQEARRFTSGEPFVADQGYSDNFFSFIHDINGDGHADILVFGFPGKEARLYLNPGSPDQAGDWTVHLIAPEVANESPHFVDLIAGGLPEIVCARNKQYGYYEAGPNPTQPWTWHPISAAGEASTPFGHGLGVGDLNGDGRPDLVEKSHFYEQPEDPRTQPWTKRTWAPLSYGGGGAQILVHDFDGDGDADIVTSYNAHSWGLGWFEQYEPGKFVRRDLVGESSTQNPFGLALSQMHALALADIDGDGRMDFVTGKRHYAHQGRDPGGLQEPALYWFRNQLEAEGRVEFVPHFVHGDSGVGVELKVADLNGDGRLDLISGSKKGLTIHLQHRGEALGETALERWRHTGGQPQDDYGSALSPQEARARMDVPAGFEVDLIAAEPEVVQPIAMCFDARGRLWVVEGRNYPARAEGSHQDGQDRILILEDADGDGTFETRKVFAESINLASGIAVGFGGVYVGAAPYLLFYPDKDQNDVPDGEAEILLDGWGWQDTHETLNAFLWGPDGWLYGCHGVFTHSRVGRPGTPDEERIPINAGLWRYHPVRQEFEVYAHGTSNPWGVDFDERGDFFVSACVIPHFYHLAQGGRYHRQAGQHFDPWTFEDIQTIADHAHYVGNMRNLKDVRGGAFNEEQADTAALGGGHAHCGLVLYQGDSFPPTYRGDAFFHNLHGHRIVREAIERDGSGHVVRHRPDFLLTKHHDHIGVALLQGPDGALYFSDWTDPQTCHHRNVEIWDRSNGRLFRVRYGAPRPVTTRLPELSDAELVATLSHPNAFHARQAQRILQERAALGELDAEALKRELDAFASAENRPAAHRLRALWTRHVCGLSDAAGLALLLDDPAEEIRAWAVTLLGEGKSALPAEILTKLESQARQENSLLVRRHLASLLQRLPLEQRWPLATGLVAHARSGHDRNIPLLCWYGIEPLVVADPARALALVERTPWPKLKDFLTRRAAVFPEGREALLTSLSGTKRTADYAQRAEQFLVSLASLPPVEPPSGWDRAKAHGLSLAAAEPALSETIARLGARFGDAEFFPKWRAVARDEQAPTNARREALELLTVGRDPELGSLARELLPVVALQAPALAALRQHPGAETAEALIRHLGDLPLSLRNEAINLLAARAESALLLLRAVDENRLAASLISPVLLDQFARYQNPDIDALIERHWVRGTGGDVSLAELSAAIEQWKRKLNDSLLSKADASRGRQVYSATCGTCHTLFGEGVALGPDLTGSNRADLAYLLENVLAPSAVVGKDYLLNVFTMRDGATLSGMVRGETPDFYQLVLPGGAKVDVKRSEVVRREELPQSLMPPGLFDALPLGQVADLVRYLASPTQVPLPGEDAPPPPSSDVPPAGPGVRRIEGESLVDGARIPEGQIRPQRMTSFGTAWSGHHQLWWTGGHPGQVLSLRLDSLPPGPHQVTLFPTMAHDYARIRAVIQGEIQEADLYSPDVRPGAPIRFPKVNLVPDKPLLIEVHIAGAHPSAKPSYMFGLDRIEIEAAPTPQPAR